jgi:hypothetical protein
MVSGAAPSALRQSAAPTAGRAANMFETCLPAPERRAACREAASARAPAPTLLQRVNAMASISTFAPFGSAPTWTVARAG